MEVTIPQGRSAESQSQPSNPGCSALVGGQREMRKKMARLSVVKIMKATLTGLKLEKRQEA